MKNMCGSSNGLYLRKYEREHQTYGPIFWKKMKKEKPRNCIGSVSGNGPLWI